MKKKVNITVDEALVNKMKQYAEEHKTSLSHIVEEHFEEILKPKVKLKKEISLVEYLQSLPKIDFPENFDWKEEYYKAKSEKIWP